MNGKYLGDCDPDHGAVAEVEEEDVRHEEGERQPTDVGSVHVGALRHGPMQALFEGERYLWNKLYPLLIHQRPFIGWPVKGYNRI